MKSLLLIEVILNVVTIAVTAEECTSSTFTFNQPTDHAVVIPQVSLRNITTTCQYLTANSEGFVLGVVRIFSLTHGVSMAIGKKTEEGAVMELHLAGQVTKTPQKFPPNSEIFQCFIIDTLANAVDVYLQGIKRTTLLYTQLVSLGEGTLVIGGSNNSTLSGYVGTMRNIMLWNRRLSEKEIETLYKLKTCPEGDVMKISLQDVIPHGFITTQEECTKSEHNFSSKGGVAEYLEFAKEVPAMKSATICAFVTTSFNGLVPGTVGSIALPKTMDIVTAIGVMVESTPTLKFIVQGQAILLPLPLAGDKEYHFCTVLSLNASEVLMYLDGILMAEMRYQDLQPIPKGTKIIIGQRQTCFGGCFEADSALNGKLRDFLMWDRVLSPEEIHAIVASDSCPSAHIVDLTAENILQEKA